MIARAPLAVPFAEVGTRWGASLRNPWGVECHVGAALACHVSYQTSQVGLHTATVC